MLVTGGGVVVREAPERSQLLQSTHLPPALRGRYRVERRLQSGMHGPSWILTDSVADGQVVLRYLAAAATPAALFASELRRTAGLVARCQGATRILDAVEEGAACWLVREWVAGENFAEALAALGTFSASQVAMLFTGIARGLRPGPRDLLVHGHLCPENVLIHPNGSVFISDHGLCAAGARAIQSPPLPYQAPEVAAGEAPTWRSDVYAAGALLYTALCGHYPLPLRGEDPERDRAILQEHRLLPPPPRSRVRGQLGHVIWRALQPRPGDRFATVVELVEALCQAIPSGGSGRSWQLSRLLRRRA